MNEGKKHVGRPRGTNTTLYSLRLRNDLLEYARAHGNVSKFINGLLDEHRLNRAK